MASEDEEGLVESIQAEIAELREEQRKLKVTHDRWMRIAGTDAMTGLPNKTFFLTALLPQAIERSMATANGVGCIMVAPDKLGEYNGRNGRQSGDEFLRQFASFLSEGITDEEKIIRVDGANFIIIVPGVDLNRTKRRSLQLRARFTNHTFEAPRTEGITLSLGVVAHELEDRDADIASLVTGFMSRLWVALDEARQLGGDRSYDDPEVDFQ